MPDKSVFCFALAFGVRTRPRVAFHAGAILYEEISRRVTLEVFESRASVENDYALAGANFACGTQQLEGAETGCAFRAHEETFIRSHFARRADHFFIVYSDCAAMGITEDFQD